MTIETMLIGVIFHAWEDALNRQLSAARQAAVA